MSELSGLKIKARRLYKIAQVPECLDCGRALAEELRPDIAVARVKFSDTWKQIQELDPSAPPDPFH